MMPRLFLSVLHVIVALHRAIPNKTGNRVYNKATNNEFIRYLPENWYLSTSEAENIIAAANSYEALISEMMKLENPFTCPHGRPTAIKMTKYELEKKFKRQV